MRVHVQIVVQLTFLIALAFPAIVNGQDLEISLVLNQGSPTGIPKVEFDESFEIRIKNISDNVIRIPDPQSPAGVRALSFEMKDQERDQTFWVDRQASIQGNSPAKTVAIQPGADFSQFVSFSSDRWRSNLWRNLPAPNFNTVLSLQVNYDTLEFKGNFWHGKIHSQPLRFDFVFERARLPQEYLWNGFPDGAMRLLKGDHELIGKTDEDSRTPLHVAARFGHTDVVKWLIENGADCNAKAYNRFTPLHMATISAKPEIIKLLLDAGADANHLDASENSPLQKVVTKLTTANSKGSSPQSKKWDEVLSVFLESGSKLDLISAILLGRAQLVKTMLEQEPELLGPYIRNQKALRTAVKSGHATIARYLLEKFPEETDVDNFAGRNGYPVLMDALADPESVELLIESGADLERRITWQGFRTGVWPIGDNATLLHFAARDGNTTTIQLLLDKGLDPFANARDSIDDSNQQTAMDVAVLYGEPENLQTILNHELFQQGDPDLRAQRLNKLMLDVCQGRVLSEKSNSLNKILKMLIERGVDPTIRVGKHTLIQTVTKTVHPTSEGRLEDIKTTVKILQEGGVTLDFFSAVAVQDQQAIDSMLEADPSVCESRRVDGYPAVHFAISRGNLELVKKLLQSGCNINLRNHSRNSGHFSERMLHVAAFWNRPSIAEYLINSKADVNAVAQKGITPLHLAASSGAQETVEILLTNGADVFAKDINGRIPLVRCTNPAVKKILQDAMDQ